MSGSTPSEILHRLLKNGMLSRAELSRELKISRPAVSVVIDKLIASGLVLEKGTGESSGGKPPVLLSVSSDAFHVIGIDIGSETFLNGILCTATGEKIAEERLPFENTYESIRNQTLELAALLKTRSNRKIAGIGLAVSGIVNPEENEVRISANFPIANRKIAVEISELSALPVFLGNRARISAEYERQFGIAVNVRDFIYISAGKSVGATIYSSGELLRGTDDSAGEIRAFPVPVNKLDDRNSDMGSIPLETALSESYVRTLGGNRFHSTEELVSAWEHGDSDACSVRKHLMGTLLSVLGILSDITDPELIVLGGRLRLFGDAFLRDFQTALNTPGTFSGRKRRVAYSSTGRSGAVFGAAFHAISQEFSKY